MCVQQNECEKKKSITKMTKKKHLGKQNFFMLKKSEEE